MADCWVPMTSSAWRLSWPNPSFPFVAPKRAILPIVSPAARKRSIADVVERALEAYEVREAGREPASCFYARLATSYGTDIDLEAVIREAGRADAGPDL
jgi:hypothetical protein